MTPALRLSVAAAAAFLVGVPAARAQLALPPGLAQQQGGGREAAGDARALLTLPGIGIRSVRDTRTGDGFEQTILLDDGGEGRSRISLTVGNAAGPIALMRPTRVGIAGELGMFSAGEGMRIATRQQRNAYGPIGLAVGRTCVYAWQWFDNAGTLLPRLAGTGQAASLRITLCRSEALPRLVAAVERMSVREGGAPRTRVVHRPRRQTHAAAPAPEKPPAPVAKIQPPDPEPTPDATLAPRVSTPESVATRRYLAPLAPSGSAPAGDGGSAPRAEMNQTGSVGGAGRLVPQQAPSEPAESLSADLPARAYRGPEAKGF
ncbi:MAG: cellulose biosynthesis protein BcsN [Methylobacterium frigidaeris]